MNLVLKHSQTVRAFAVFEQLQTREREMLHRAYKNALVGCVIVVLCSAAVPMLAEWCVMRYQQMDARMAAELTVETSVGIGSAFALITFPIALLTRPKSRSDRVDEFIDQSTQSTGGNDNPLLRFVIMMLMLGILIGEFFVIDAIKFLLLKLRLRQVDRQRAALILSELLADPRGIDPRKFLRIGEEPLKLRATLGYLMAFEWADISPRGDWLELLSRAKRQMRHDQESLFAFN